MNPQISERLWGYGHAFDNPVVVWLTALVVGVLALAVVTVSLLSIYPGLSAGIRRELWLRIVSWGILAPALCIPILAGSFWTIVALFVIALLCNREYTWGTGLFREKLTSGIVVLGIVMIYLAVLDHWYNFFVALIPLSIIAIASITIPLDRPEGYIQRTGLAAFGLLLFGGALGHLAYMANDWNYRAIVLLILVSVSLNDVFAFIIGKTFGGPKLLPHTSPNKTISGSLGALILTTTFVTLVSIPIFEGTEMGDTIHRLGLGLIIGALGQFGDLMLSSIKRDIGIKDMGAVIPGHGGVLDRFNSLLLVSPAAFHYIGYFIGFGLDQPIRIFF